MNLIPVTPQDLRTTASPTFGNLYDSGLTAGRVTYAGASGLLQDSANLTFDGTNLSCGGNITATGLVTGYQGAFNRTTTITGNFGGIGATPILTLGDDVTSAYAMGFNLGIFTAGYDLTNGYGILSDINIAEITGGTSVVTNAWGWACDFNIVQSGRGSSLTITNFDFLWVRAATKSFGTITTLTGLRIEEQTAGSTNWQMYSEGGNSYHAGFLYYGQTDGTIKVGSDADGDLDLYADSGIDLNTAVVNFNYAGTAADSNSPTHINTPTGVAAAQAGWLKIEVNGTTSYVPYWQ
jgi:hypothetical protein